MSNVAILALEDGTVFTGISIGHPGQCVGEIVFNTAMSGYQETLTDPSYHSQIITFTTPHIGNTGVNTDDVESNQVFASGLVVRSLSTISSNWRATDTLEAYLKSRQIVGISDVDTRAITHHIRDKGSMRACIDTTALDSEKVIEIAKQAPSLAGCNLAQHVTTPSSYVWPGLKEETGREKPHHVVVMDFGVKHNILRELDKRGSRLTVVPAQTSATEILQLKPDGILLSNGPGDPTACTAIISQIQALLKSDLPILGICLGFQLLALAFGAKTRKMKFGHHGVNHPVSEVSTGKVIITSQNHNFDVDESSLPTTLSVTHRSLFDGTLQGFACNDKSVLGFQGHPEASPGPHDFNPVFDDFVKLIVNMKN